MIDNGHISARQFMILVALFGIGDAILYVPSLTATAAKQDAWISTLIGWGEGFLLTYLYVSLSMRYPNKSIFQFSKEILGKWMGKVVAVLFISYFFIDASLMLMEIGDFVTTQIMQETPIEIILVLFLVIIVMGVRSGTETFSRVSELLFPYFLLLFFVLIAFIFPQIKIENAKPVLAHGIAPVIGGNFRYAGYLLETVILIVLFPLVNRPARAAKAYILGILLVNFFLAMITAVAILVLGADITILLTYPSYTLAQKISIGNFFERIEVLMAVIWFITLFVKITVCYYATSYGIAYTLGLRDYRHLTLPLGMIMIVVALATMPNRPYFDAFVSDIWMPYSLTYGLFLPVLLLSMGALRKKPVC
ncbi:GerAB/ArcD/ProY family transporter [Brevibacillus brevis]|uniref:GerAB/ArcD/ProY family transporter n=1 Tax=Brevibacillus brevis TaxID=1393 RepID=UPI00115779A9|nr:endospore germination permease [Lysinibacillus sp. SDF0063]TQR31028.1 spore gernimation protein [Lysinibacillus sp. SDF0063]